MKFKNINRVEGKMKVLIAPLDWGLGHATRCIPIIYELLSLNFEVMLAAEGDIKSLLQKEFPGLAFLPLRGYRVHYGKNKHWLSLRLLLQFPKLIRRIYLENHWLKKTIREHNIDAIISDNRLGLYHKTKPCVYITHQLKIKTGYRFTDWLAQKIHYFFINKYSFCWVPDSESENNLAGELSHPQLLPKTPVYYLGPLSRFEKIKVEKKYHYLVLISGPEPQRTIFEELVLKELKKIQETVLFVRGLPGTEKTVKCENEKIEIHNHLSAADLNKAIRQSHIVISRSGYTTIMDLIKLQQKAILVPTPGQTEQEYLAEYLMQKKIFFYIPQNNFTFHNAIKAMAGFPFITINTEQDMYKDVIRGFVEQIRQDDL